jgi:hypothetical protein
MSKLSGPGSRGSFGLLAGKKLSRASRILSLPRSVSKRFCSALLIRKRKIYSNFSYFAFFCLSQLIEDEKRGKGAALPESCTEGEESSESGEEESSDSSDDSSDGDQSSVREEGSPKVDISG